jgi:hypothetical protein
LKRRRPRRYAVNGRRLFVVTVVILLALVLVFRHRVERALGIRRSAPVQAVAPPRGTGTSTRTGASGTTGVSVTGSGSSTKSSGSTTTTNAGSGTGKSAPAATTGGASGTQAGSQGTTGGGTGTSTDTGTSTGTSTGSAPPPTSYPGAPTITSFYADLTAGKTADAYALLAPGLAAQRTPNAFGAQYATVKSAQVETLALQSAGNFSRTFTVSVAFALTSGTVETKNGTITVQDQSGGVGAPDWQISALTVAP